MPKYSLREMKVNFPWETRATCNVCRVLEIRLRGIESFQNKRVLGTAFVVQRLKSCNISRKFSSVEWSRLSSYGVMNDGIVPDIFIGGYRTQNLNGKQNHKNPNPPDCYGCQGYVRKQQQSSPLTPPTTRGGSFSLTVKWYASWGSTGGLSFTSSTATLSTKLADCGGLPESAACEETTCR